MRVWPNIGLTVYAEDQLTVIPAAGGADVPDAPYYQDLKRSQRLLDYDPLALSGDAITVLPVTRISAALVGYATPEQFGAIGDGVVDDTAAVQAALDSPYRAVFLQTGKTYKTTASLWVRKDCKIFSEAPGEVASAKISYTGSSYALIVNSEALELGPGSAALVRYLEIESIQITAPSGSGILFGTSVNPSVSVTNVNIDHCAGYAMLLGASTYFFTMRKCVVTFTRGVKVLKTSDLFTVDNCAFGWNTDHDLDIGTLTFHVNNSDFELNSQDHGNVACILLRTGIASNGYGAIQNCRFGAEDAGGSVPIAPYDIHMIIDEDADRQLQGVRLLNNTHFSGIGATDQKTAPILIECGLGHFDMRGCVMSPNYTSSPHFLESSGFVEDSAIGTNFVDDLYRVPPSALPMFVQRDANEGAFITCRSAQIIDNYQVVSFLTWEQGVGLRGIPRVHLAISAADNARYVFGVALTSVAADKSVCVARHGCIVHTAAPTAFDTSSSYVGAPVYLNAAGYVGLTPTNPVIQVGRVAKVAAAGSFVVDTTYEPSWSAMPTTGTWKAGDFARKSNPAVAGVALSQYVIAGWNRLTTGSNHVAGTDWVEARELTGT